MRWSIALSSVVAAVAVVICAVLGGAKGIYGALIGIGVVAAFFGISIVAVGRAAKVSPMAMMVTAMASYLIKIIAFAIVLVAAPALNRVQRPRCWASRRSPASSPGAPRRSSP